MPGHGSVPGGGLGGGVDWQTPFWQLPPEQGVPFATLVMGLQVLVTVLQPPPAR